MEVHMSRIIRMILAIIISLVWITGASAEIKEGLWEITTKTTVKGMPMQMPATTMKQCITKKDPVPQQKQDKSTECKIKDQKISGDTVTYTMECKTPEGTMITNGKTTYKANTFDGATDTTIKMKGQPDMQMSGTTSGKYLGPCPK